jgi:hypothetical protein
MLIDNKLAVWSGQAFQPPEAELPDDLGLVIRRIKALF